MNTLVTPECMRPAFRCVRRVSEPGADAFTRASFTIEDRVPGLLLTDDKPVRRAQPDSQTVGDATVGWETAAATSGW